MVYKKVGEFKTFSSVPRQLAGNILVKFIVWQATELDGTGNGVQDMKAEVHYIESSGRIVQNAILSREDFITLFGIDFANCR